MAPTKLRAGVCYYPEHWEPERWRSDAARMRANGVAVARIAEFAWSRMEPREGRYEFEWLDRAVGVLYEAGIEVVLGTPTACPPNWLVAAYPEVLPHDEWSRPRPPGVRGHRCVTSPTLRRFARAIVERLAQRFGSHPAVIGWQIDNEFLPHSCTCSSCADGFRAWVRARYGDVNRLNAVWGTVVWSGEYSDFSEVNPPVGGSPHLNPSYLLDWHRFQNETFREFQREQVEIVRRHGPNQFVTHNSWSVPVPMDYHALFEELDLASLDYYPSTDPERATQQPYAGAMQLDLTRGFKRAPFWIMEQLSGPPGAWMPMWRLPPPGFIRAFGWQAVARGANAVVFFRWRSGTLGAEQFWHGLLGHDDVSERRLGEFKGFASELDRLSDRLAATNVQAKVALLYSYEQHMALQLQPQSDGFDYYENLKQHHEALVRLGLDVDVVDARTPLDGYRFVIAPHLYVLDEVLAGALWAFARAGGALVLTHRTGVKNAANACVERPLPGLLAECAGVEVTEYDPIGRAPHHVTTLSGRSYQCSQWCDLLDQRGAVAYATYADDFYAGTPAVTAHAVGRGSVYYVGTQLEAAFYVDFYGAIAERLALTRVRDLPEGVQASVRVAGDSRVLFLFNLSRTRRTVNIGDGFSSLLLRREVGASLDLAPYAVEILVSEGVSASSGSTLAE